MRPYLREQRNLAMFIAALTVLALLSSGCGAAAGSYALPDNLHHTAVPASGSAASDGTASEGKSGASAWTVPQAEDSAKKKPEILSPESAGADGSAAPDSADAGNPADAQAQDPTSTAADAGSPAAPSQAAGADRQAPAKRPAYDPAHPMLMGFSVGDKRADVAAKFGKPAASYRMNDPSDPLTVAEYAGFSFGFDAGGKVKFIEVDSAGVDPGIGGVQVGQSADAAIHVLGKPTADTGYVVNYESRGLNLRLDVDPNTRAILAIKLFPLA